MLVLCGIPGSGKSTIAAALAAVAEASGTLVTLVDFDKQAGDFLEDFDPEKWKKHRATSLQAVSQALESLKQNENSNSDIDAITTTICFSSTNDRTIKTRNHIVIVDDTMHYRSMRAECWRIARAAGAAYIHAHINCPLETALERNELRPPGQRVPEEVLRRTAAIFEPPEENQHCPYDSDTYKVLLDIEESFEIQKKKSSDIRSKINGKALWSRVEDAWGPPAPAPFDEKADEARIAEARRGGKQEKKNIAEDLNRERRRVLERFRTEVSEKKVDTPYEHASELIKGFEKYCRDYYLMAENNGGLN
ncbi:hypothetical protein Ndes2437B_g05471 [Nannochloris sp. 'desiccata']